MIAHPEPRRQSHVEIAVHGPIAQKAADGWDDDGGALVPARKGEPDGNRFHDRRQSPMTASPCKHRPAAIEQGSFCERTER